MYALPSASITLGPLPETMKRGTPPVEPKARTGLFNVSRRQCDFGTDDLDGLDVLRLHALFRLDGKRRFHG